MGFFKDERVEGIENELVVVKGDVSFLQVENKELLAENTNLKQGYNTLAVKHANTVVEVDNLKTEVSTMKQHLEKLMQMLEKEENDEKEEKIIKLKVDDMISEGWYSYENLCKAADVGVQPTAFKYFLYEKGVLDRVINMTKNSFKVNMGELAQMDFYINGLCKVYEGGRSKNELVFKEEMIQYVKDNVAEIKECYNIMKRKNETYKKSKQELESKVVEDYQAKINEICGNDRNGGYNKERWGCVYNMFRKAYPMLEENYARYKDEFGYISKVKYVVTQMGLGNYLLKIACELYA